MKLEDNVPKILAKLDFYLEDSQYEADFNIKKSLPRVGIVLSQNSTRFKSTKAVVKHLEKILNQKAELSDGEYSFDIQDKLFNTVIVYEENELTKMLISNNKK